MILLVMSKGDDRFRYYGDDNYGVISGGGEGDGEG